MKFKTAISHMMAATLFTTLLWTGVSNAATTPASQTPQATTTQSATTQPAAQKFDGAKLYQAAFEALRDHDIALTDPTVRAKWVAEWEHKYDGKADLQTEAGTDKACLAMMHSLNHRFDYYLTPTELANEQHEEDPTMVGIGSELELKGAGDAGTAIIKALPKTASMQDKVKAYTAAQAAVAAVTASDTHPLVIIQPMEESPSIKAGLQAHDRITAVDGQSVNGKTINDIISTIRGKENTQVTLTIDRADATGKINTIKVTVTRAKFVEHVVHTQDLGSGVMYIKLDNFMSKYGAQELFDALTQASKSDKAVVLDLRGNPGGSLDEVEAMAQFFLNSGIVIEQHSRESDATITTRLAVMPEYAISSESSSADPTKVSIDTGDRAPEVLPDAMPLVVLVDGDSYSASEILSGALQANHRAVIMGEPTGGKGVGQEVIQLPFNRDMHVTNFQFLPGGVAMNWVGVVPNIEVPQSANFQFDDQSTDAQLAAAKQEALDLISQQDKLHQEQNDLQKKHQDEFNQEKQLGNW